MLEFGVFRRRSVVSGASSFGWTCSIRWVGYDEVKNKRGVGEGWGVWFDL